MNQDLWLGQTKFSWISQNICLIQSNRSQRNHFLLHETNSSDESTKLLLNHTIILVNKIWLMCSWNEIYHFQSSFLCLIQVWPFFSQHVRFLTFWFWGTNGIRVFHFEVNDSWRNRTEEGKAKSRFAGGSRIEVFEKVCDDLR